MFNPLLVPIDRCQQNLWRCECSNEQNSPDPDAHESECGYVSWYSREEQKNQINGDDL